MKDVIPEYKRTKLIDVCQTRWISRIERSPRLLEMYPAVLDALSIMRDNESNEWKNSTSDAYGFISILCDFDFIITLVILNSCLGYTHTATAQLQRGHIDIIEGIRQISAVKTLFKQHEVL